MEDLPKLFGSSGVRALVNVDLTSTLATRIGLAIATHAKAREVAVARDTRVSGPMIEKALVSGLVSGGANARCLGIVPTPVLAYLTREMEADAGVMITASHNPPQYNGIKIFNREGVAYDEHDQSEIERIIEHHSMRRTEWLSVGKTSVVNETSLYARMIKDTIRLRKKWRVVVDPGCGATYRLAPSILKNLGCTVTALNAQPDGFFPARSSEPTEDSLTPLMSVVKELGADVGLAYDGDGDRVAFIDERGNFVDFDRILAAYAAWITKAKGGGTVVTNVEASMCVEKMVEARGGKVARTKVGDIYLSDAIKQYEAIFGGEPCGAWIHPQFHYCPDGLLSSVLLLKTLDEENKSIDELISETPEFPTLRKNINCPKETKYGLVKNFEKNVNSVFPAHKELSTVDGIRLTLANGWILVRASGTEPVVRLTVEGESLKAAKEIMKKGARLLTSLLGKGNR